MKEELIGTLLAILIMALLITGLLNAGRAIQEQQDELQHQIETTYEMKLMNRNDPFHDRRSDEFLSCVLKYRESSGSFELSRIDFCSSQADHKSFKDTDTDTDTDTDNCNHK